MNYRYIAPCHFGLEAVVKKEINALGYEIDRVEDGRVYFLGDEGAIARANIFLRSAERVLLEVGSFQARTFEELFQGTRAIEWEQFIPRDGRFWVTKAASRDSALFSPSDIQSVMKKAMVERLKPAYGISVFPETGDPYPLRVFIKKNEVSVGLDTTGDSLHKRGYRKLASKAPIAENLAAALISLTPWRPDRVLADIFCGSGTFPIEAALIAAGIAPGVNRSFTACDWMNIIDKKTWYAAYDEARDMENHRTKAEIYGSDIDPDMIRIARQNAKMAGVDRLIDFKVRSAQDFRSEASYGFLISNPPYGMRLMDKEEMPGLYNMIGDVVRGLDKWSAYIISSYDEVEKRMGMKAAKNRKLYNGDVKTYFYMFPGPRPTRDSSGSRSDRI